MNSRLDTLQAAILLAKLSIFDQEIKARHQIGKRYHDVLSKHVKTMHIDPDNTCVYAQYTIEVANREYIQQHLKKLNIPTAIHYPTAAFTTCIYTPKWTASTFTCIRKCCQTRAPVCPCTLI